MAGLITWDNHTNVAVFVKESKVAKLKDTKVRKPNGPFKYFAKDSLFKYVGPKGLTTWQT